MVFVFGSNEKGQHGGGAALAAKTQHGAVQGVGFGHHGNSFAIPTCAHSTSTPGFEITPETLYYYILCFILYAKMHPELEFQVTRVGTGLAGWGEAVVAPMFAEAPDNCLFDSAWDGTDAAGNILLPGRKYWGTYGQPATTGGAAPAPQTSSNPLTLSAGI